MTPAGVKAAGLTGVWGMHGGNGGKIWRNSGGLNLVDQSGGFSSTNETFDGSGLKPIFAASVRCGPGGRMTLHGDRFINASRTHLNMAGETLEVENTVFGSFAQATTPDDHTEAVFIHAGRATFSHFKIDPADGISTMGGRCTALIMAKSDQGLPIDITLFAGIIVGAKALRIPYALQSCAYKGDVTWRIGKCAIQSGIDGKYFGATEQGSSLKVIDLGGNVDFDTGTSVDLTYPFK